VTLRNRVVLAAVVLAATLPHAPARAQSYFGQNQVQYDQFRWQVKETEHFLIYYYPEEAQATTDAARMAERAYARLSRILDHQFREKKPIMLFESRNDFGQNNVTGDLGEGTGGVTEALRHRMLLNFTGDYRSFEHVLTHEMVHAFQYDIFARGKAGAGLQTLAQVNPPLWFAEGMAEYLSLGPSTPLTNAWMRDAALNGKLPTIEQLTDYPDRFFPYRYGHAFWTFIGQKWGDEAIGQIMNAAPSVGIERAFKRELGLSLEDLGDEWKEDMQQRHLPQVGNLDRPRKFAAPLLTQRKSGGEIFLAPSLSPDGKNIVFLSNGSFMRGEVFIDLWLGDAETGKRITRLVKSTFDPNFEELRLLYSQSAFSPDGQQLAFTAQREGRDVLYLLDVKSRKETKRFNLPLEGVTSPSWSPDGKRLVFSGSNGGLTDLYVVDIATNNVQRLTSDRYGDLQPQWSPDGKMIAFASDRGDTSSFTYLRFPKWRVTVLDLEKGTTTVLPGQAGLNINPQWSPDGRSIAYVSDRTGIANLFLYDFDSNDQYQLTNVVGSVSAITEYSPAISWARKADRLAFTYYENGDYTIWSVNNPRSLKKAPFREKPAEKTPVIADNGADAPIMQGLGDPLVGRTSVVRGATADVRSVADAPAATDHGAKPPVSISMLLDSADLALPDTTKFRDEPYRVRFQPDYIARPSIGYVPDNYGRNVFGGTTVILSDMLGNNRLALSGEVNGRIAEARMFIGYTNLSRRWQYSGGLSQAPYYFLSGDTLYSKDPGTGKAPEKQEITTFVARQAFAVTAYPLNRFTRLEFGGGYNNVGRQRWFISRNVLESGRAAEPFHFDSTGRDPTLNYIDGQLAYVSDNTLFGYTGPIYGRRYRFQVSPVIGSFRWVEYLSDYRRYDPILFNYLTVATRFYSSMSFGRNETAFPKYIARPDFVRGYDRNNSFYLTCPIIGANPSNCSAVQLLGSRVAVANAELRFPLVRRFELGVLPIALPPLDGLFFYDVGAAWSKDQSLYLHRPENYDVTKQRYPLRSYGFGLRLNLFNYAIVRWDYAVPLDQPGSHGGFWTWSLWPSF
jgi:Tol biopolymer transport system component